MHKKQKLIAAIGTVSVAALIAFTSAYFVDGDTATNTFKIGHNVSTIEENFPSGKFEPGKIYTKEVKVKNKDRIKIRKIRIRILILILFGYLSV
jgi:alternate signal-mediated exported protein